MPTLVMLDVTGVQRYIFGSNRLRENIGASHLVECATGIWVVDALQAANLQSNLSKRRLNVQIDTHVALEENPNLAVEVIYRGGGNMCCLVRDEADARQMISHLSMRLLTDAPGLGMVIALHSFDWNNQPVGGSNGAFQQLMQSLRQRKRVADYSTAFDGLGVTLDCRSTSQPAVDILADPDRDSVPVSAETYAKWMAQDDASQGLEEFLPPEVRSKYAPQSEFDKLGRAKGESSYLAVVHADGNGMGKRMQALVVQHPAVEQNRACLNALRAFSNALEQAGATALEKTLTRMVSAFNSPGDDRLHSFLHDLKLPKPDEQGRSVALPIRPLVFGGDDVTFVCDGRLGLPLTVMYLEAFAEAATNLNGGPGTASAGVAIVKVHYPFARAYDLAEQLTKSAKRDTKQRLGAQVSALDWHIAASGLAGSLGEIREREFSLNDQNESGKGQNDRKTLLMRPLSLHHHPNKPEAWRSWEDFNKVLRAFNTGTWPSRRNKLIGLRERLREGDSATQHYMDAFSLPDLPKIDTQTPSSIRDGWIGKRCGYFDIIEALDFVLPLEE